MEANLFLLIGSGVLIAAGVYLMLDRAMTRMIMGVLLIGNGANLLLLQSGGQAGAPPILGRDSTLFGDSADPLAQAMILTAIVISMAMSAFMLALAYRQYRYRTDDVIERDEEDRAIAARPSLPAAAPDHDRSDDPETGKPSETGDSFGPRSFETPVKEADDEH
ncbi:Na(+)/H(+) antiporter subunit C [Corynebacterium sp. p3-SID1056]|uniref:Na(+)/H(+) antiporter subunit C n=1 Tax=Corynebacterium sp. p3-SID1056 TaxID=2916092 RepID=UPI0021A8914C|nr:Na(+)/H(+) antiporter subunit C [Corynebacterium sp. p3-SID1056]MCT2339836.1 Na(+)/H(+) antiporter subunit C [Corynebacterium sp. p3-SID1056]